MKFLLNNIIKNKEFFLIFFLFFILSAPFLIEICNGYLSYAGLDKQEFLLWDFSLHSNLLPYKDLFYPYGYLHYFRGLNVFFTALYYLISPLIFIIIYFIFKKVFSLKYYVYLCLLMLYLFVLNFTGFEAFVRYGVLMSVSLIFSYFLYKQKVVSRNFIFLAGVILAFIFSLLTDQGIYLIFNFVSLYLINDFLKSQKRSFISLKHYKIYFNDLIYLIAGFLIGLIPLFIFLIYSNSLWGFVYYFTEVKNIVTVAKTPFFLFITSPANIFTLSIVYASIFYLIFNTLILRNKFKVSSFLQICLILNILIMEQKSIIRSIDTQITFISLTLLLILVYDFLNFMFIKEFRKKIYFSIFILFTVILYTLNVNHKILDLSKTISAFNLSLNNKCFENNLNNFKFKNPDYPEIINFFKKQSDFNNKLFSFPTGDSASYVLLRQKPPYYNAIFEGSSDKEQNYSRQYIKENRVKYILLNTDLSAIQDAVPDYIRQPKLFSFIINNYYPFTKIGSHLILKKEENQDFFNSKILDSIQEYKGYLINVYLYKIPFSEGFYKSNLFSDAKIITFSDLSNLKLNSRNKFLVLIPQIDMDPNYLNTIEVNTEDKKRTRIYLNPCKKSMLCVVNLSNIPLFYKSRIINSIKIDNKFKGTVKIYEINNSSNLW